MKIFKNAFTLVEVLIVIVIIGVVAALTITALINSIGEKSKKNQMAVIEAKLIKGLNLLNLDGGINSTYSNTEDFLNSLKSHMKILTICSEKNLRECIPYNELTLNSADKKITRDKIKFYFADEKLAKSFYDIAGFIMGDGTSFVVAYNKECISEDQNYDRIHPCLVGFYDINGKSGPNKFGKDLITFGGINVGSVCIAEAKNTCITTMPFVPSNATADEVAELQQIPGLASKISSAQYAGAILACGGYENLASHQDVINIVNSLYLKDGKSPNATQGGADGLTVNTNSELYNLGLIDKYVWTQHNQYNYTLSFRFESNRAGYWHSGATAAICVHH